MCDSSSCSGFCGQEEFKRFEDTLRSGHILYPTKSTSGDISYGITVHHPAQQWEIVAVQGYRSRHVAFVSTAFCLDRVLEMAARISGGH